MQISATALEGMNRAQTRLESTARRLAKPADPATSADLSADMVALLEARNGYAANANVAKAVDEMARRTIDLLA